MDRHKSTHNQPRLPPPIVAIGCVSQIDETTIKEADLISLPSIPSYSIPTAKFVVVVMARIAAKGSINLVFVVVTRATFMAAVLTVSMPSTMNMCCRQCSAFTLTNTMTRTARTTCRVWKGQTGKSRSWKARPEFRTFSSSISSTTTAVTVDNDDSANSTMINNNNNNNTISSVTPAITIEKMESTKTSNNNKKRPPPPPPPPLPTPDEFPSWSYDDRPYFSFELIHQSTKSMARVGRIHTPHGYIDTPSYVAVATNAALKGVDWRDADDAGQQLAFANTYHLLLHPGADLIEEAGGIHQFTNRRRDRPFITDSGGFQVFSLAYGSVHEELTSNQPDSVDGGELKRAQGRSSKYRNNEVAMGKDAVKVSEDGVIFRSYRDGSKFLLTPESTVQAQKKIGADIIIPLDELPPYHIDRQKLVESVARSHRWEARSLKEHLKNLKQQAMYCVVHGGIDRELRTQSVEYLTSLPFDGFAIGGSLGNGKQELKELLDWMMPLFDNLADRNRNKPRHLLGIADEESIRHAVTRGIDTLDSCYPTRLARHGTILTREGSLRIKSGKHSKSFKMKLDDKCKCSTCQHYDRSYLWHLFKANEPLAVSLAATHNIHYMVDLMADIRDDIMNDRI
jgi:queuine tRNA-ribosyltransferase